MSFTAVSNAALRYLDGSGNVVDQLALGPLTTTPASQGPAPLHTGQLVPTSLTPLALGPLTSIGRYVIVNRDPTNVVNVYTNPGGKQVASLGPGQDCSGYAGADFQAPYVIALVAACEIEYFLVAQ